MTPRAAHLLASALAVAVLWCGCDDKPKIAPPPPPPKAAPPPPPAPAAAPALAAESAPVELAEKDFAEGADNRDPFRSFLAEFAPTAKPMATPTMKNVLLRRYALDELRLIAVISRGPQAMAMFQDPRGLGVAVRRRDLISKDEAMVKEILADKVVLQIQKQSEDKGAQADRVIDLHPKEKQQTEENE